MNDKIELIDIDSLKQGDGYHYIEIPNTGQILMVLTVRDLMGAI